MSDGKRWWKFVVVRRITDGIGRTTKRDKQVTEIFAQEQDVFSIGFRRCPTPFDGTEGDVKTEVWYVSLGADEPFPTQPQKTEKKPSPLAN